MKKDTVIIGLGNLYMRDEGIGVRVADALVSRADLPGHVEVLDLGTGGLSVFHALQGRRKAVLVDCAFMDEAPGVWRRFRREEVRNRLSSVRHSLHEGDVLQTLDLAERLGELPDEVWFIGIQPGDVEPGEGLSPALQERFKEYLHAVLDSIGNRKSAIENARHAAH